jgi:hypothetical protein
MNRLTLSIHTYLFLYAYSRVHCFISLLSLYNFPKVHSTLQLIQDSEKIKRQDPFENETLAIFSNWNIIDKWFPFVYTLSNENVQFRLFSEDYAFLSIFLHVPFVRRIVWCSVFFSSAWYRLNVNKFMWKETRSR